ncbi:MAG: nuclear transport factor 2 family protein, partial [Proteobacteria bacterium]|nr:nuclear transport factor 2 family protein [Pseudomonadota bacterium]
DTAVGSVNGIASHVERQEDGTFLKHDWLIHYHDRLVREAGSWRFLERRMEVPFIATAAVSALGFNGGAGV